MVDKDKLDNLNRQIMVYQSQGYNVLSKDEKLYLATMEKKGEQSILVHALLALFFCWLLFIPNMLYYIHASRKKTVTVFG
jgi:hypothetical protein